MLEGRDDVVVDNVEDFVDDTEDDVMEDELEIRDDDVVEEDIEDVVDDTRENILLDEVADFDVEEDDCDEDGEVDDVLEEEVVYFNDEDVDETTLEMVNVVEVLVDEAGKLVRQEQALGSRDDGNWVTHVGAVKVK